MKVSIFYNSFMAYVCTFITMANAQPQTQHDVGGQLYKQLNGFEGESVSWAATIDINLTVDEAFYLFTPEGEAEWAIGFEPIFPGGVGVPSIGLTFWTHDNVTDGEISEAASVHEITFWLITLYDEKEHRVTYARVKPLSDISLITVDVNSTSDNQSSATIRYDITGISKSGNEYVRVMDEQYYKNWIEGWQVEIENYLKNR